MRVGAIDSRGMGIETVSVQRIRVVTLIKRGAFQNFLVFSLNRLGEEDNGSGPLVKGGDTTCI